MKQNLLETLIGFIVLSVAAFFLVFSYNSQDRDTTETYTLNATFQNVDGIIKGSDVNIGGIIVGKVESLKLDPKTYNAVVKISVDKDVQIPTDSRASITSSGFLGGKFLAITPGGDDDFLKEGEQFKYTQSSINLESLIGKFMYSTPPSNSANSGASPAPAAAALPAAEQ